jgi:hypothetical protein
MFYSPADYIDEMADREDYLRQLYEEESEDDLEVTFDDYSR